ncbi:hypothetical protein QUF56_09240 [Ureibacillus composti]|nr:hypothetical protein [Ureibacillus composti]
MKELEQFLVDEKELLTDLALDVANANSPYDYTKAKEQYNAQVARVNAIQDAIDLIKKLLVKRVTSN